LKDEIRRESHRDGASPDEDLEDKMRELEIKLIEYEDDLSQMKEEKLEY
jgi:hypothetical protein